MQKLRRAIVLALGLSLAGCGGSYDRTPPEAYLDWRDRWIALTGLPMFGHTQICQKRTSVKDHPLWVTMPVEKCVRMTQSRRWTGIWASEFEESRFCPGARAACFEQLPPHRIWLTPRVPFPDRGKRDNRGLYRIDFVGRSTRFPGYYGGGADQEVVVDRLISIERLPDQVTSLK